jgi:hypothetical protein
MRRDLARWISPVLWRVRHVRSVHYSRSRRSAAAFNISLNQLADSPSCMVSRSAVAQNNHLTAEAIAVYGTINILCFKFQGLSNDDRLANSKFGWMSDGAHWASPLECRL